MPSRARLVGANVTAPWVMVMLMSFPYASRPAKQLRPKTPKSPWSRRIALFAPSWDYWSACVLGCFGCSVCWIGAGRSVAVAFGFDNRLVWSVIVFRGGASVGFVFDVCWTVRWFRVCPRSSCGGLWSVCRSVRGFCGSSVVLFWGSSRSLSSFRLLCSSPVFGFRSTAIDCLFASSVRLRSPYGGFRFPPVRVFLLSSRVVRPRIDPPSVPI